MFFNQITIYDGREAIMTQITWDDVLKRKNLVGGDIESQEDGIVYRGPLTEIKDEGGVICFNSSWCARMNSSTGEWEKWDITSSFVNKSAVRPEDIGDGRIFFRMPFLGVCTIFPKGGSRLDPGMVKGLETELAANTDPSHPSNLYESLVAGTR